MTPCCAPEPPASVFATTVGAYPMLQSYATPSSVAQSTMSTVQLLMTPSVSLPSPSTGRPIQRHLQSHNQLYSNNSFNLVSPSRPMGSIQLLMTAVQPLQPTLQPPRPTLPHRFLLSPSTGRSVDYPLWEVPAPFSLMRWPLRSRYRCVDNLFALPQLRVVQ